MRITVATAIIAIAVFASTTRAEIQPITDLMAQKAAAMNVGPLVLFVNSPIPRRQQLLDRPDYRPTPTERQELMTAARRMPFRFAIVTPYVAAAYLAAEARRRFEDPPRLIADDLNAKKVYIHVVPGERITDADAIENVVLRRGGQVIHPLTKDVRPVTVTTAAGGMRQLTEGDFTFDFSAFDPSDDVTVTLVGRSGNFEWTFKKAELAAMQ